MSALLSFLYLNKATDLPDLPYSIYYFLCLYMIFIILAYSLAIAIVHASSCSVLSIICLSLHRITIFVQKIF